MRHIFNKVSLKLLLTAKLLYQFVFQDTHKNKPVIFVAGVQRSGTNMLMNVLERSFDTDVFHERDKRAFENYEMRNVSVIKNLHKNSTAKHFVIKSLCELQDLSDLLQEFPHAKVIWVFRHYDDAVNSMLVSFRNQAKQVKEVVKDRNSSQWRGKGMTDETHELVKSMVHDNIDDASAAAIFWYYRNILFFDQDFVANKNVMAVSYESLVQNPKEEFKRIFDFADLKYTDWVSKKVHARSISKRKPHQIDDIVRERCDSLHNKFLLIIEEQKD